MFVLPELQHPYNAYEPHIDAQTMEIHHSKHHGGYVKKLNQALVDANMSVNKIEELFENINLYPAAIRNNAGGHYNHSVFWTTLDTTVTSPDPELLQAIEASFGVLDTFKETFTEAALSVFGSGWCWLVLTKDNKLDIVTTKNQDNPLMSDIDRGYPLFGIDVWEHAYYLSYQNKRADYINAFWSLLNWDEVSRRFKEKPEMNEMSHS
jgi:Fe-Mn family superoxide dismutase